MAFERLLRLTKKCPGYVVSGLRNANVGIATVTQKSFDSQYYITRALFGTRSLFAMTARFRCFATSQPRPFLFFSTRAFSFLWWSATVMQGNFALIFPCPRAPFWHAHLFAIH